MNKEKNKYVENKYKYLSKGMRGLEGSLKKVKWKDGMRKTPKPFSNDCKRKNRNLGKKCQHTSRWTCKIHRCRKQSHWRCTRTGGNTSVKNASSKSWRTHRKAPHPPCCPSCRIHLCWGTAGEACRDNDNNRTIGL